MLWSAPLKARSWCAGCAAGSLLRSAITMLLSNVARGRSTGLVGFGLPHLMLVTLSRLTLRLLRRLNQAVLHRVILYLVTIQ